MTEESEEEQRKKKRKTNAEIPSHFVESKAASQTKLEIDATDITICPSCKQKFYSWASYANHPCVR